MKPRLRSVTLPLRQILFSAGDKIETIYFPTSGAVSLVVELSGGERIESAIVGSAGLIGGDSIIDGRHAVYTAIVQVAGEAFCLPADFAAQIADESSEFRSALAGQDQLILAQAQQSAACNAAHSLEQRLARWLLHVREVTESDTFLLTQDFLAEMLGVSRTSVSLVAQTLQTAGLISYRRGLITIEKLDLLKAKSCECYETIHARYAQIEREARLGRNPAG